MADLNYSDVKQANQLGYWVRGCLKRGIPKSFFTITILKNMKVSWDDYSQDMESGWWYTYPSEKWWSESQLGVWNSQMESHKVPNHQPVFVGL